MKETITQFGEELTFVKQRFIGGAHELPSKVAGKVAHLYQELIYKNKYGSEVGLSPDNHIFSSKDNE